jgi:hypothetical protein
MWPLICELATEAANDTEGSEEDLDKPVFSVITGKYRHAKRYEGELVSQATLLRLMLFPSFKRQSAVPYRLGRNWFIGCHSAKSRQHRIQASGQCCR